MSVEGMALAHHRFRAPRQNGGVLAIPPLAQAAALFAANRDRPTHSAEISGLALDQLARRARRELAEAAYQYTSTYRSVAPPRQFDRLLLAGHQPQLFHPGVWCKNFALAGLGQSLDALAINLLVDSDTVRTAAVRVPGGTATAPFAADVPYDRAEAAIPYEERTILDAELFRSFGQRAQAQMESLVPHPLLEEFWPRAMERARATGNLGLAIAQARHLTEAAWGVESLELPQSQVCGLESFRWFTAHLLTELPRFRVAYNEAVHAYRRANHVRSPSHPVPDLATNGDWIEAPYWVWQAELPRRRRLFVRAAGDRLELADLQSWRASLPGMRQGQVAELAEALGALGKQGIRLRSRALVTTLFARIVASDLFIHGIGGAKYDEVTDQLARRFLGVEPPGYLVLSGTLELPIDRSRVNSEDLRTIAARLRELEFHPERFLTQPSAAAQAWIAQKRAWIARQPTIDNARTRCQAIRQANAELQPEVQDARRALVAERDELATALAREQVFAWREYAFCLYPAATLRNFLLAFLRASS